MTIAILTPGRVREQRITARMAERIAPIVPTWSKKWWVAATTIPITIQISGRRETLDRLTVAPQSCVASKRDRDIQRSSALIARVSHNAPAYVGCWCLAVRTLQHRGCRSCLPVFQQPVVHLAEMP